jgi:spermidine synthase
MGSRCHQGLADASRKEFQVTWLFVFFFLSGFCSILYELIWLRLAMAQFGVTTALVSIVLSVFMAGLGAGSWLAGAAVRRYADRIKFPPLRLYGLCELLIGISALLVPVQLTYGNHLLERMASHVTVSSATYYAASGTWLAISLIPWCACMGATIPLVMFAISRDARYQSGRSFSFLYLSNVLGAVAGAILPLFLIELYGFHATLRFGALVNILIFVSVLCLTFVSRERSAATASLQRDPLRARLENGSRALFLLFTTGLTTMAMEVIWIRLFTPYVGPLVYSFATILATYLFATFFGSQMYRFWSQRNNRENNLMWVSLAFFGLLPLLTSDARFLGNFADAATIPKELAKVVRVFLGVAPFAAVIGFLTPMLVDRWSGGDPDRAGRAYAVNVVGCIVGPVLAGFLLLPYLGERTSMLLLVLPWFFMAIPRRNQVRLQTASAAGVVLAALAVFFLTKDYEYQYQNAVVLRDSTATVVATGTGRRNKRLLVNGIGMTVLTPITKMMVHFTLASLSKPAHNVLIICFGMGTSFKSAISWGVPTTAVELVPSVPKLFTYYHPDADQVLKSPLARIVIDDGRRYLERSGEKFDAIVIDPPPPVAAAGSSLLYSRDFYDVVKEHLRPGGILQQWLPEGDEACQASVTRALTTAFRYVRAYSSVEHRGTHYFASMSPIPERTAERLVELMPATAVSDMMEWTPAITPAEQFQLMLSREVSPAQTIALAPDSPALQDDRPVNEYFLLRTVLPWHRPRAQDFATAPAAQWPNVGSIHSR